MTSKLHPYCAGSSTDFAPRLAPSIRPVNASPERWFGDTIGFWVMGLLIRFARIGVGAALLHAVLASASWFAVPSGPAPMPTASGRASQQSSGVEAPLPVFEFHSGFWVNLHHFLYLQARLNDKDWLKLDNGRGAALPTEASASLINFPATDLQAWQAAVAFYAQDLARRDLLLNGDMEIINNRLAEMEACTELAGKSSSECTSGLQPELVQALDRAAPVYRAHWWAEQDRANREWIAQIAPMVRQMGVELSQQLAEVYEKQWPVARLRVDVVWYGGPYGAYTSLSPTHVTVASHDPRNQGIYGFEVLFHETSHALSGGVTEAIAREFRQRDKPIPRDLWHALVFYTTGELLRRDLALGSVAPASPAGSVPSIYQPYAERFGLYSGAWEQFRTLLDLYWKPYLDSRISFDTAIARIASAQ